jgi:hypothetical protein
VGATRPKRSHFGLAPASPKKWYPRGPILTHGFLAELLAPAIEAASAILEKLLWLLPLPILCFGFSALSAFFAGWRAYNHSYGLVFAPTFAAVATLMVGIVLLQAGSEGDDRESQGKSDEE